MRSNGAASPRAYEPNPSDHPRVFAPIKRGNRRTIARQLSHRVTLTPRRCCMRNALNLSAKAEKRAWRVSYFAMEKHRGNIRLSFRGGDINFNQFLPNAASKQPADAIVRYPREVSRNVYTDVSVLRLNAPFISAHIRLSGERACCRVYAGVAMHFSSVAECRPFAAAMYSAT